MGADAIILDVTESVELQIICHTCHKVIDLDYPILDHEECADDKNQLRVDYRFKNLEML